MIKFFTLLLFVFPSLISQVIILHCGVLNDGSDKPISKIASVLINKNRMINIAEGHKNLRSNDLSSLQKKFFVMKNGKVYKNITR